MNPNISKKNWLVWLLAITALVVWGHNGYRVLAGLRQADFVEFPVAAKWPASVVHDSVQAVELFTYRAEFRDPFQNWLVQPEPVKPKIRPGKSVKVPRPDIRLIGILKDAAGPLALMEDIRRQTQFVHEKDEIDGVRILQIDSSWVECVFRRERYRIELRRQGDR